MGSKAEKNIDGWSNVIKGLGNSRDSNSYYNLNWVRTDRDTADAFYAADEMGGKIARIIPLDGTREGVMWNMDKDADQEEVIKFIEAELYRLDAWSTVTWAWTLSRVYGGALIFLSVDDGKPLDTILNPKQIKSIRNLVVMDRWEMDITSTDIISDLSSPDFGKPEFYTYQTASGVGNSAEMIKIHHTRVIRFDGVPLPVKLYKENNYWHDSIYSALAVAIRNYATTLNNVSTIISDFNQPVYQIEGLSEAIAQDEDMLIVKKLQTVDMMRSQARAIVLDAEDKFQNVSTNVAGGKDLVDLTVQRLVAGTDIPHTRLLGNSPSGLGATGEAELINYYDSVKALQNINLRRNFEKLVDLIFAQKTAKVAKPEDFTFEFTPLFQQKKEIEIKTRKMQAEIDQIYMNTGVIIPQEAADSRFSTGRYSYETVLEDGVERKMPEKPTNTKDKTNPNEPSIDNGADDGLGVL